MSTNYSEITTLYVFSRDCVWLRRMFDHKQNSCDKVAIGPRTIIYKDNATCVAQMQTGYIKLII
jgi:hypothetical protein